MFKLKKKLQVMHGGHLFSSYLGTSQNEATGSVVPRIEAINFINLPIILNNPTIHNKQLNHFLLPCVFIYIDEVI